jgi:hypothetical protein
MLLVLLLGALDCWPRSSKLKQMRCRCTVLTAVPGSTFCGGSAAAAAAAAMHLTTAQHNCKCYLFMVRSCALRL